jgi:hypothetical protein
MDTWHQYYESVYGRDFKPDGPYGTIQWKGTRPCIDLHCKCGYQGHLDADYCFYHYRCPMCGTGYAVGTTVRLMELSEEEIGLGGIREDQFMSDEPAPPSPGELEDLLRRA